MDPQSHQQSPAIPREHFFNVSIAKHLFYHPSYGIVTANDPIRVRDAAHYGLSPLILYGLSVPGTNVQWLDFAHVEKPQSLLMVLAEAWLIAGGLRGHPDILRVNKHLAQSSPDLAEQLARIGVELKITDSADRALSGALRSVQHSTLSLLPGYEHRGPDIEDPLLVLRRVAFQRHLLITNPSFYGGERKEIVQGTTEWLALPSRRVVSFSSGGGQDWSQGPWLSAWEKSLPPEMPRFFKTFDEDGDTRLLTGYPEPEYEDDDDDDDEVSGPVCLDPYDYDNTAELAKGLIECWTSSPREIAKYLGVTQRELNWFIKGTGVLERGAYGLIHSLFELDFDDYTRGYTALGPFILVARKLDAIEFVYDELTQGGDAEPFEIVPSKGEADPSWRYVLVNRMDDPVGIVMAARGSKVADKLGELFLNYEGIQSVDPALYRDVVSTCARAALSPDANVREMLEFMQRYRERW